MPGFNPSMMPPGFNPQTFQQVAQQVQAQAQANSQQTQGPDQTSTTAQPQAGVAAHKPPQAQVRSEGYEKELLSCSSLCMEENLGV